MKNMRKSVWPTLVLGFLVFNLPSAVAATVAVSGEGQLQVAADLGLFNLTVESEDREAEAALKANTRAMERVRQALAKQGMEEGEVSTGGFSIRPQWTPRPRAAEPDWRPQIIGYVVSNRLSVETERLDKVGPWIQAATEVGATEVGQLRFSLVDSGAARSRAIAQAVHQARRDAEAASQAAGVELGALQSLRVDGADFRPLQPRMEMAVRTLGADAPSITPGEVEVKARVEMVFETLGK